MQKMILKIDFCHFYPLIIGTLNKNRWTDFQKLQSLSIVQKISQFVSCQENWTNV